MPLHRRACAALSLTIAGLLVALQGCGAPKTSDRLAAEDERLAQPSGLVFGAPRAVAIPGRTLVLDASATDALETPLIVRTDAGAPVPASLYAWRVTGRPDGWLEMRPEHVIRPLTGRSGADATLAPDERRLLACVIPPGERPEALNFAFSRVVLDWREPPSGRAAVVWGARQDVAPGLGGLLALLAPARSDPSSRWRTRLLADRLAESGVDLGPDPSLPHPALEAVARQHEDRWRIALARLRAADAALADRVVFALTRIVVLDNSHVFPAWSDALVGAGGGAESADALRDGLLDAGSREAVSLAEAWLAAQPPAQAWIEDDAVSPPDDTGAVRVRIGVANLLPQPVTASIGVVASGLVGVGAAQPLEMVSLRTGEASRHVVRVPAGAAVEARIGEATLLLSPRAPLKASPPGARIGPLVLGRSAKALLAGAEVIPTSEARATGALRRRATDAGPGAAEDSAWELVLTIAGVAPTESVLVSMGPADAPLASIRARPDGYALDEARGSAAKPRAIQSRREGGEWTVAVPIPRRAIVEGRWLLLGVRRESPEGVSSWPRPCFPWDGATGRAAIDLAGWGGLEPAGKP